MGDGVFRSKKGFTAVGNQVVRDREISFKAKGLYMLIQSYITMPDVVWKKADFENMALEGTKAFDSAWNELKEAGYLKVHIFPNSSKKSRFSSEFELLDEPQKGVHTFYYNAKGVVTATNVTKNEKKRVGEKEDNLRYHQNGSNVNGGNENDNVEKGVNEKMDNNNKILNSKSLDKTNINTSINQSEMIDLENELYDEDEILEEIKKNKGIPYSFSKSRGKMEIAIKKLVEWNFCVNNDVYDKVRQSVYQLIVDCLVDMTTEKEPKKYGKKYVLHDEVINEINKCIENNINSGSLRFFVEQTMEKYISIMRVKEIKNSKLYMKTVIWNNFSTYKVDYNAFFERTYTKSLGENVEIKD